LNIAFIFADQQKPHEGVVRPFINFAKALENKYEISFLLLNCSSDFLDSLRKIGFQVIDCKNQERMIQEIKRLNSHFVFTDDDLKRLKLADAIKKATKTKIISYVQILYGSHSIANCFDLSSLTFKKRLLFTLIRYIPFSFFSHKYANLLKGVDLVLANSKVTATFLHSLYNVEVSGIVYPPIDTEIFQSESQNVGNEVTLYLGSHLGDSRKNFVRRIIAKVVENGYSANLFGNPKMASEIISEPNNQVIYYSNLTDTDLAKMYSRSKLTICPQKWEQFGLVTVESISCGTPVLAFNCMGFQETITKNSGWLANNEVEFLQMLNDALKKEELLFLELRNTAIREFSIEASGEALRQLLEKYFNQKI
jgi:glycosyltransferase involved in cell wall biosynthesis